MKRLPVEESARPAIHVVTCRASGTAPRGSRTGQSAPPSARLRTTLMADRYDRANEMDAARRLDELEAEIERLRHELAPKQTGSGTVAAT